MNSYSLLMAFKTRNNDICIVDSATTYSIFKDAKYFCSLQMGESYVTTISGNTKIIEGSGTANILLPRGTKIMINNALFSPRSNRNLLSFRDVRCNGYHLETGNENDKECLYITSIVSKEKCIHEKFFSFSSGLYYTNICIVETNLIVNQKFTNLDTFKVWHDRLGHPGSIMMRKIIENSNGHPLKNQKIFQGNEFFYAACS